MFDGSSLQNLPLTLLPDDQWLRTTAPRLRISPWWVGHEAELANALQVAKEAAPHLAELADFLLPRLPRHTLASSTIKGDGRASSRILRLAEALGHQWISYNGHAATNAESVDCDATTWRQLLDTAVSAGLPEPAVVVVSPWKGTAHLVWLYETPFNNRSPAEMRIRKGIKRGLATVFDGDQRFANRLGKNPFRIGQLALPDSETPCGRPEVWKAYRDRGAALTYHTEVRRLATVTAHDLLDPLMQLAEARGVHYLCAPKPRRSLNAKGVSGPVIRIPGTSDQRNALFLAVGTSVRSRCTADAEVIGGIIDATAAAWGRAVSPASRAEMSRSISQWMREKWRGPLDGRPALAGWEERAPRVGKDGQPLAARKPCNVGTMKGEAADAGPAAIAEWNASTKSERQSAAAERTNARAVARHDEAIRAAFVALAADTSAVTLARVAMAAEVSLRTVKARASGLLIDVSGLPEKVQSALICLCGGFPPQTSKLRPEISPFFLRLGEAVRLVRKASRPTQADECRAVAEAHAAEKAAQAAAEAERVAVAAYDNLAHRMSQRSAAPETVPPIRPDATAAVVSAHRTAGAARASARRRADAREDKRRGAVRAAERATWHEEHVDDDESWRNRLEDIGQQKAAATERELQRGGDVRRLERIDMIFGSVFKAEHSARRAAQGNPAGARSRPKRLTQSELATIPW